MASLLIALLIHVASSTPLAEFYTNPSLFSEGLSRIGIERFFEEVRRHGSPISRAGRPVLSESLIPFCGPLLDRDPVASQEDCAGAVSEFVELRLPLLRGPGQATPNRSWRSLHSEMTAATEAPESAESSVPAAELRTLVEVYLAMINLDGTLRAMIRAPMYTVERFEDCMSASMRSFVQQQMENPLFANDIVLLTFFNAISPSDRSFKNEIHELSLALGMNPRALILATAALRFASSPLIGSRSLDDIVAPENFPNPQTHLLSPEERSLLDGLSEAERRLLTLRSRQSNPSVVFHRDDLIALHFGVSPRVLLNVRNLLFQAYTNQNWVKAQIDNFGLNRLLVFMVRGGYVLPASCARSRLRSQCLNDLASFLVRHFHEETFLVVRIEVMTELYYRQGRAIQRDSQRALPDSFIIAFMISEIRRYGPMDLAQLSSGFTDMVPEDEEEQQSTKKRKQSVLRIGDADESVFEKSMNFFSNLSTWPTEPFVRISGLDNEAALTRWMEMIRDSPEGLLIRPLSSSKEWRFFGSFVKFALSNRFPLNLRFAKDVVVAFFLPQYSHQGDTSLIAPSARSFHLGFHQPGMPTVPFKMGIGNIGKVLISGTPDAKHELISSLTPRRWVHDDFVPDFGFERQLWISHSRRLERLQMSVRREYILEDSWEALAVAFDKFVSSDPPQITFEISFVSEEAMDAGGPFREFICELASLIFSDKLGLFEIDELGRLRVSANVYHPGMIGGIDSLLKVAATVLWVSFRKSIPLGITFTRPFYKSLLRLPLIPEDYESVDPDTYKRLKIISREMEDPSLLLDGKKKAVTVYRENVEPKTFVVSEVLPFGQFVETALPATPGFASKSERLTTERHWKEYSDRMFVHLLDREKAPSEFSRIFATIANPPTVEGLEAHLRGVSEFPVEIWKTVVEPSASDVDETIDEDVISVFWDVVASLSNDERGQLFRFWTAIEYLPPGGFPEFQRVFSRVMHLAVSEDPSVQFLFSHTCQFHLLLPNFNSIEEMKKAVTVSIRHSRGFGST